PPDTITIVFGIGADGQLGLHVPVWILSRLMRAVAAGPRGAPDRPAGALLVELALASHLDGAERTPAGIRLDAAAPPPDTITIVFGIGADGQLGLHVPVWILSRLMRAV
ncbi:hypothetical protein CTI14_57220, partial [Methylobacterium radiotolerans]